MMLEPQLAGTVLERALRRGGDFAEVYVEERTGFGLSLDDGKVERPQAGRELGASVRVVQGDATYFGYVDGVAEDDLVRVADSVAQALRGDARAPGTIAAPEPAPGHLVGRRPEEVEAAAKADVLRACDEAARAAGGDVAQVRIGYSEARRRVTVYGSDGRAASDDRTRVRLGAQVVARRDGRVETGTDTLGGHAGWELLEREPEAVARSAAGKALTLLDARDAPSGRLPVVVGNGFGGVLLHEAVGHGLEADAVQKRASVYAGKLGEQLAEPFVTAYDDGRRENEWGSDGIDDEGTPTRRTTVIEDGRLTSYLYDLPDRAQGRRPVHRQRQARVVPPPADPAHDQHLLRARRSQPRGADRLDRPRPLRGLVRGRPGGARHRRLRLRGLGGVPDRERRGHLPGPRGDPGGQRPRGPARAGRHCGRPGDLHRVLREGRPERARRGGAAPRSDS